VCCYARRDTNIAYCISITLFQKWRNPFRFYLLMFSYKICFAIKFALVHAHDDFFFCIFWFEILVLLNMLVKMSVEFRLQICFNWMLNSSLRLLNSGLKKLHSSLRKLNSSLSGCQIERSKRKLLALCFEFGLYRNVSVSKMVLTEFAVEILELIKLKA